MHLGTLTISGEENSIFTWNIFNQMIHLAHLQQLLSEIYGCNNTPSPLRYCMLINTADPGPTLLAYLWCSNDLPECTYKVITVITMNVVMLILQATES